jgi:hypothetical protein
MKATSVSDRPVTECSVLSPFLTPMMMILHLELRKNRERVLQLIPISLVMGDQAEGRVQEVILLLVALLVVVAGGCGLVIGPTCANFEFLKSCRRCNFALCT